MTEVHEKWGFGMAPPKPATQRQRLIAADYVYQVIDGLEHPSTSDAHDMLSVVKGLFSRVLKQDQWDWFIVARQLGYPSAGLAKVIAENLYALRRASVDQDTMGYISVQTYLRRLPARRSLAVFLERVALRDEANAGWVYLLSTREQRDLLKIGMTTRSVEARVREINSATGVAIPYGVRNCWRVIRPAETEKLVHRALESYRLRADREFFRGDFKEISGRIQVALKEEKLEIRTLGKLAALSDPSEPAAVTA